jgi:outer membrane scaffolding protein for murein synthesis (MipA/OmpV family)
MGMRAGLLAALAAASAATCLAQERTEPLWEMGLGVAGIDFPDYRGSSHRRGYVLPAPYFIYRGDLLRADRNGARAVFFKSDRWDLNLSAGASLPVHSNDNPQRAGMSDLKPSVELGPSLAYTMWKSGDERLKLDLRLPLRGAVTIESSPRFIGGQFSPNVNLDVHDPAGFTDWNLGLVAGVVYNDSRYNRYFYSVDPAFATASRPAYDARGGFGGVQFLAALSKRFPKFWVGGFVRYDTLNNAVFESSPLVTTRRYVAGGFAISYIFKQSNERVRVDRFGDERK